MAPTNISVTARAGSAALSSSLPLNMSNPMPPDAEVSFSSANISVFAVKLNASFSSEGSLAVSSAKDSENMFSSSAEAVSSEGVSRPKKLSAVMAAAGVSSAGVSLEGSASWLYASGRVSSKTAPPLKVTSFESASRVYRPFSSVRPVYSSLKNTFSGY